MLQRHARSGFEPRFASWPQPQGAWPPTGEVEEPSAPTFEAFRPKTRAARSWKIPVGALALLVAFSAGALARPFLEREVPPRVHGLRADARIVGTHLRDAYPSWLWRTSSSGVQSKPPRATPHITRTKAATNKLAVAAAPIPAVPPVATEPVETAPVETAPPAAPDGLAIGVAPTIESATAAAVAATSASPLEGAITGARSSERPRRTRRARHAAAHVAPEAPVEAEDASAGQRSTDQGKADAPAVPAVLPEIAKQEPARGSIDELIVRALREPGATATGTSRGRGRLARAEIAHVMRALQPQIDACAGGIAVPTGADLMVTVAGDGTVSTVRMSGPLFATKTAGCIVRVVKDARFPESSGMRFPYRYVVHPASGGLPAAVAGDQPKRIDRPEPEAPTKTESPRNVRGTAVALPKLLPKKAVSDDPLDGLRGRAIEGGRPAHD